MWINRKEYEELVKFKKEYEELVKLKKDAESYKLICETTEKGNRVFDNTFVAVNKYEYGHLQYEYRRLKNEYEKLIKEKETGRKQLLSKHEFKILSTILEFEGYKYITRSRDGHLALHKEFPCRHKMLDSWCSPNIKYIDHLNYLFNFIKWENEPYNIKNLLGKEYMCARVDI